MKLGGVGQRAAAQLIPLLRDRAVSAPQPHAGSHTIWGLPVGREHQPAELFIHQLRLVAQKGPFLLPKEDVNPLFRISMFGTLLTEALSQHSRIKQRALPAPSCIICTVNAANFNF